jgi:hypothetical protein
MRRDPMTRKQMMSSVVTFAAMFLMAAAPNAHAGDCSVATLQGAYGFHVGAIVLPAGTPRAVLGRIVFDGRGNFENTLTFNDNGVVSHMADFGGYTVNVDCTGTLFSNGGTRTVELVIVNSGKEFYQVRTDSANILFFFNAAKKQFPGEKH